MIIYQHQRALNDTNGNPRRVWVVWESQDSAWTKADGTIVRAIYSKQIAVHDEGEAGGNLPEYLKHACAVGTVDITPAEYRNLKKQADAQAYDDSPQEEVDLSYRADLLHEQQKEAKL